MYNPPKRPRTVYSDVRSPVLALVFKLLCSGLHSTVSSPHLCEETERWPLDKFPFDVQISKSTCPRCFVCLLPLSGPHPLTPVISLSALKQTSLPDTEILWLFVQIPSLTRAESRDEGKLSHVQNESEFLPLLFSSQFY